MSTEWGEWRYDPTDDTLRIDALGYYVPLREITSCAGMLSWIFHLKEKTWFTAQRAFDFLSALEELLEPERLFCGGGRELGGNAAQILAARKGVGNGGRGSSGTNRR